MNYTIVHEDIVPDGWDATIQFNDGSVLTLHNPDGMPVDPAGWIAETVQAITAAQDAQQDGGD
jgi:hypothetical protein